MNMELLNLFQAIETIHTIEDYSNEHKYRWIFSFKQRREYNKLKEQVKEKILSLQDDKWTIKYLYELQQILIAYYMQIEPFQSWCYLSIPPTYEGEITLNPKLFIPTYFIDKKYGKDRFILLSIVSDEITFEIFDGSDGGSFSVSSSFEVQKSQKKIELVCKQALISTIMDYLNRDNSFVKNN